MIQIQKNINNIFYLFKELSLNKDYITNEDIIYYLDRNKIDYTNNQINDIMKRLDINKDGKIDFDEFEYLFGLANPKNKKTISYYKFYPSNNYINNKESNNYQNCFGHNKNNFNNYIDINYKERKNSDMNKYSYQESVLNQNNCFCSYCFCPINFNCIHKKKKIDQYLDYNNQNYYNDSYNNNFISNNIEDLEYSNNLSSNTTKNIQINNFEFKDKFNLLFSNDLNQLLNNNNHYNNDINNIYNKKNYIYDYDNNNEEKCDNTSKINNNIYNYTELTKLNSSEHIMNNIKNNVLSQSLTPNRKGQISSSLSLRVSPLRKYFSGTKNINNMNNNIYEQHNYNQQNIDIIDNNIFNYNKLKRNHSQENFIVNKKKKFQNDISYNSNKEFISKNDNILKYFQIIMKGESQIELAKINLISRGDFNFRNAFNLFDEQNKGYITFEDLKNELEFIGIDLQNLEVQLLMNRFNKSNDTGNNFICYNDFCNAFLPYEQKYININNEKISENNEIKVFSPTTRLYMKGLIKDMSNFEIKLNKFKKENLDYQINIKNILKEIDFNEKGFFNKNDLISFLKEKDAYTSLIEVELLFKRLDKKSKGKIRYEDFLLDSKYL